MTPDPANEKDAGSREAGGEHPFWKKQRQPRSDVQLGPPTMGDHEDEARREAAYGRQDASRRDPGLAKFHAALDKLPPVTSEDDPLAECPVELPVDSDNIDGYDEGLPE